MTQITAAPHADGTFTQSARTAFLGIDPMDPQTAPNPTRRANAPTKSSCRVCPRARVPVVTRWRPRPARPPQPTHAADKDPYNVAR